MNMGTPGSPEGVPHWTNKAMLFNKLKKWQKTQRPFHVFFELGGDLFVENVLEDVTAVLQESPSGGYRPDILLERGDEPPVWIEIVHTSPPTAEKLEEAAARGIDVFEIHGKDRPIETSVKNAHISCRSSPRLRRRHDRLIQIWCDLRRDFDIFRATLRKARAGEPPDHPNTCGIGVFEDFRTFENKEDSMRSAFQNPQMMIEKMKAERALQSHAPSRPTVEVPFDGGTMLVAEPTRYVQKYVVGAMYGRTVTKAEFLAIIACWRLWLMWCEEAAKGLPRPLLEMKDELDAVEVAVSCPNGITDWDFVSAYREGNLFLDKVRSDGKTDIFVTLDDDLMSEIPPCPLITGPALGR